jgi:molybdopterin/thiamine biosynthesis adenylyltransferase
MMDFTDEQIERYSRHLILSEVGVEGQGKISKAKVLVIGAGGLGSSALLYLAASGVGKLGIVDGDVVDLTNLQRQVIHFTQDVDKPKVDSAAEKIARLNPNVQVHTHHDPATSKNMMALIEPYDFIIDGTDNFPAKFLINDACVLGGKPFSHAGVLKFVGQTMTVLPGQSACYRCVFGEPPPPDTVPSCAQAGVLGAVAGVFGTLQATEALKYFIGTGDLLTDRIMVFDALEMKFRNVRIKANPHCPVCGPEPQITTLVDYERIICELKT